jgi:hypothetical protein
MLIRALLGCVALCAAAGPRSAVPQSYLYGGIDSEQVWAAPYPPEGNFRGLWAGRLDEDELLDAVVLDGTRAVYFQSPAQDHRFTVFSSAARALVPWPALSPFGRDRVLVSEPDRLALNAFGAGAYAKTVVGGGNVAGAQRLELLVLGRTTWLAGLAEDGRTLFLGQILEHARRRAPKGPSELGYLETTRFTLPDDVLAWELLQWDGLGPPELAVQTADLLEIRAADASSLLAISVLASSQPVLERFRDGVYPADRLFLILPDALGVPIAFLVDQRFSDPLQPELEPGFAFVDVGQVGFDDYDGDGVDDLWATLPLLLEAGNLTLGNGVLLHGASSPQFPLQPTFLYDPEKTSFFDLRGLVPDPPQPTQAPFGDAGDFDLDGDLDFLFVSDDYDHLNFVRGDAVDEEALVPSIVDFAFTDAAGQLTFQLDLHVPLLAYGAVGRPATLLGVDVHYQSELDAQIEPVARLSNATFPLSSESLQVPLSFGTTGDSPLAIYQFRLRVLDGGGLQLGPPLVEYFTASAVSFQQLASQPNPWGRSPLDSGGNGFHRRAVVGPLCVLCP